MKKLLLTAIMLLAIPAIGQNVIKSPTKGERVGDFVWASGRWSQAAGQTFSDIKCFDSTCTDIVGRVEDGDFMGDTNTYKITRRTSTGLVAVLRPSLHAPCRLLQTLTFDFTRDTVHWSAKVLSDSLPAGPFNLCQNQEMDLVSARVSR